MQAKNDLPPRLRCVKIYTEGKVSDICKKLEELGLQIDWHLVRDSYPFIYVDVQGIVHFTHDMSVYKICNFRELSLSRLMSLSPHRHLLSWVAQGDKHEAVVYLPFGLRAKYVITEGKETTLCLVTGEYPREGVKHVGYLFACVEDAKKVAEIDLQEELKKNKLQMI